MTEPSEPPTTSHDWRYWPLVTLGLLGAAWLVLLFVIGYTAQLVEAYGPAPDVVDALGRDTFVNRRTWPFYTVMGALDCLAVISLIPSSPPGWPRVVKVVAIVVLFPSVVLHGLLWFLSVIFVV